MRHVLSILFVLLFGMGPLATTVVHDDASLPACCRRLGAHHCAMASTAPSRSGLSDSRSSQFHAPSRCPLFNLHGNASPSPIALFEQSSVPGRFSGEKVQGLWSSTFPDGIHLRKPALRGPPSSPRA